MSVCTRTKTQGRNTRTPVHSDRRMRPRLGLAVARPMTLAAKSSSPRPTQKRTKASLDLDLGLTRLGCQPHPGELSHLGPTDVERASPPGSAASCCTSSLSCTPASNYWCATVRAAGARDFHRGLGQHRSVLLHEVRGMAFVQRLHRANEWDTISTGVVHEQTASLELTMPTFGLQEEISPALEPTQTQNYHRVSLAVR